MRKLAAVLFTTALMFGWNISSAAAGMYVSGNISAVNVEDSDISYRHDDHGSNNELSFDTGFGFMAAYGYAWNNGFRAEGEIGGRFNEMDEFGSVSIDDGYLSTFSLMANVFYNLMPDKAVSPFIGAGVGLATIEADIDYDDRYYYEDGRYYYDDDYDDSEYDTVLAYQLAAGVSFAINEHMKIDLQYRYFATEDPEFDNIELEYATHNGMVGLRYNF